ncbi:UDP-N-acetylglucosamine 2-epimerase (non-hydrolyzing) [Bradyrhizobium diazoefficiens]|nr:UDP-N-acetylglucosamine 2-epimerase (non-hydrolyzing) [Bradyrhizobium diazoefficiens]MBR0778621.1 UDP-N-acetylglucosamine 2-epimerase (non-hydrolyzing) [Bradyrhizobium diazoefficiens]
MQSSAPRILVLFGTRPEAIKMAPVVNALRESDRFATGVCVSGQHRQILDPVLRLFDIVPDLDLGVMRPNQSLGGLLAELADRLGSALDDFKPSLVLVHGDTTTAMVAAIAAFYRNIPVGHVEAGLRTGSLTAPWPEEFNRRVVALATRFHFAPTEQARLNLLTEGVSGDHIHVTGNTVIDALRWVTARTSASEERERSFESFFSYLDPALRLIVVTGHRRENFGDPILNICRAIRKLASRTDVQIVYPVHPNPNVRDVVKAELAGLDRVFLIEPVDYEPFVYLVNRSYFLLTDSGGLQEEGASLGKPVLVMRDRTERPEGLRAEAIRLIGSETERIVSEVERLLDDEIAYASMARSSLAFGDGTAAMRIRGVLEQNLDRFYR